ncbi:DUF3501 family protein [Novosphingobium tardum]|uniref:DUF3501 family protein n=1 Tax=Novosphingobium tardum TaxID=1538021 RepID=A0ABV8RPK6_9SPHN
MPRSQHTITADDLMPLDEYETIRAEKKQEAILRKRLTRLSVGPHATVIFESWDSMWLQIQEMLRIEKGGAAQIADELAAYDPMVPKGSELTMTLLFEVEDPVRRDAFLRTIGGVEDRIFIQIGEVRVPARADGDVERTRASDGKTSAVHFLHFDFTPEQVRDWVEGKGQAMVVIDHPNYGHAAMVSAGTRDYLSRECFA